MACNGIILAGNNKTTYFCNNLFAGVSRGREEIVVKKEGNVANDT
jgi:hypothetical protein